MAPLVLIRPQYIVQVEDFLCPGRSGWHRVPRGQAEAQRGAHQGEEDPDPCWQHGDARQRQPLGGFHR